MEFGILTDSATDLPLNIVKELELDIVNFPVHIEGKELIDDLGETFDKESFFEKIKHGATATTSQVNSGTYYEKFKKYVEKRTPLLYIAFSSQLSGSFQSAVSALNMIKEEYKDPQITIVDSQAASLGEGLLAYCAAKMRKEGTSLSQIVEWLEENKRRIHSWVTVDDIKHLQRGGRISAASAVLGTMLNVKPIIYLNQEGKLEPFAKVRGRKKAIQFLIDKTVESIEQPENKTIFVGYVGAKKEAAEIKAKLQKTLSPERVIVTSFGPAIAAHTGYGSLAIFTLGKKR